MGIKLASLKDAGWLLGGAGLIGIPALAAYLGNLQATAESKLDKDKDFAVRKKKIQMLREAINSVE